jgi:hypothetical protein
VQRLASSEAPVLQRDNGTGVTSTAPGPASGSPAAPARYRVRVVGHASPRWRNPRPGTPEARNLELSRGRTDAVEDALRSLFVNRPDPVEFDLVCDPTTADSALEVDWQGSSQTLGEARGDVDSDDPQLRRVDVVVEVLESGVAHGGYTEEVEVQDESRRWSINVDVVSAEFGAAGSWAEGHLMNRATGQMVKGRWVAGVGGGGGVSLPIPTVSPGSWTDFTTTSAVSFRAFDGAWVRFSSIDVGIGAVGYSFAGFVFPDLMEDRVSMNGLVFNQWGLSGSVTLGTWSFTREIPPPPTDTQEHTIPYVVDVGSSHGHRALFDTGSASLRLDQLDALQHFVERLP